MSTTSSKGSKEPLLELKANIVLYCTRSRTTERRTAATASGRTRTATSTRTRTSSSSSSSGRPLQKKESPPPKQAPTYYYNKSTSLLFEGSKRLQKARALLSTKREEKANFQHCAAHSSKDKLIKSQLWAPPPPPAQQRLKAAATLRLQHLTPWAKSCMDFLKRPLKIFFC